MLRSVNLHTFLLFLALEWFPFPIPITRSLSRAVQQTLKEKESKSSESNRFICSHPVYIEWYELQYVHFSARQSKPHFFPPNAYQSPVDGEGKNWQKRKYLHKSSGNHITTVCTSSYRNNVITPFGALECHTTTSFQYIQRYYRSASSSLFY